MQNDKNITDRVTSTKESDPSIINDLNIEKKT